MSVVYVSGVSAQFGPKKVRKKNRQYLIKYQQILVQKLIQEKLTLTKIFNYIKSLNMICSTKMSRYFYINYIKS